MAWPTGVTLRTCSLGPDFGIVSGDDYGCDIVVSVSRPMMTWGATGSGGIGDQDSLSFTPGLEITFQLPVTDQAGWYIGGLPIDVSDGQQSHVYTLTIKPWIYNSLGRKTFSNATLTLSNLAVPTGDDTLDLDKSVATSGAQGGTVTIPDLLASLQASVDDYKTELEEVAAAPTDAFVADRIEDPASQTTAALNAAYAPFSAQYGVMSKVRGKTPPSKVLTTFQAGHGFTLGTNTADASSNVNDTVNHDLGSQAATVVTLGNGTVATLGNAAVATTNFTGQQARLRFRATNLLHISRFEVYAGSGGAFTNRYAWGAGSGNAGLYRAEVNGAVNYSRDGEWIDLDLSFADAIVTGTPDRTALNAWQIRVADDNTGQKVTINAQGIYAVPKSPTYPNGVVSFTWDDSVLSPLTLAKPLMDTYGFLATYYAILDVLGTSQGGVDYMTLAQMKQLYAQGNDVAPHCTTLARHSSADGMMDLTADQLEGEFQQLKAWAKEQGFTRSADLFATPQGKFTPAMIDAMGRYFNSHRTTVYFSRETIRPSDVMRLRCIPLPGAGAAFTAAQCTAAIDAAYAEGAWVIFMGHQIVTGASASSLQCTQADFNTICNYVASKGIPVRTVSQVLTDMA